MEGTAKKEVCISTIFRKSNAGLSKSIIKIIDEFRDYLPLTVRQVFYQLVGKLIIEKNLKQYKRVSRVLVTLRENELVKWSAIEDNTRRTTEKRGYDNLSAYLNPVFDLLDPMRYGRCYVQTQQYYIEVSTEKDALARILERTLWPYCTRLNIVRGQVSATMVEKIARRFDRAIMRGKFPVLLHFGDLDPSGVAIPKSIKNKLKSRHDIDAEVVRVALTPEQASTYNLLVSVDAVKKQDPNYKAWVNTFGKEQSAFELDALHPGDLQKIMISVLNDFYDMDGFDIEKKKEHQERLMIANIKRDVYDLIYDRYPEVELY